MSRRLLAAVAAAALTCGLAACNDGQEDTRTDPPAEIDVGTVSDGGGDRLQPSDDGGDVAAGDEPEESSETAADIPAPDPADFPGMDENTPEGAEQAVRFYFANVYWGYQAADESRTAGLYSESCEACQEFSKRISDPPGGVPWGSVEIEDFGITNVESENFDHEVGYIFTVGEHEEPTSPSGELDWVAPVDYTTVAGVNWVDGEWKIEGMSFGEAGSE